MTRTAFFFDERCLWHVGQLQFVTLPVGGWVQPPSGSGLAEPPDTKRRLKSPMDVSGLTARLDARTATMADEGDLARVHPRAYLDRFRELSDAGALDPLGRMLLPSESYRWMMDQVLALAAELCGGRVAVVHEGGYSEAYVTFCGHALLESLSGERTSVEDPMLDFVRAQQLAPDFVALQRRRLEQQARVLGLA